MADNEFLWNQFCKLGEMMGDGLHHEDDGAWIPKEYKRLMKILCPEISNEARKTKADKIDSQMVNLLSQRKCECGGDLKQSRKGSKICYCIVCNKRYKAKAKK